MKNSMKSFLNYTFGGLLLITILTACNPDPAEIKEACRVLEKAGVERNFGITEDEKRVMTRKHKQIVSNITVWYRKNCP